MQVALEITPIFFRELKTSAAYVVTNQLASWSILDNQTELHKLVAAPASLENIDHLIAQGLVIECNPAGKKAYALASETYLTKKYQTALRNPSLIMVVPTLRCDHKCAYCQVSRAPIDSDSHDQKLDPTAVASYIDSIADASFKLEFQGGEPLLAQSWLQELTIELRRLRGKSFDVVICSALGPAIKDDFLEWAIEEDVQFSVSFDGFHDLHKKIRPHISIVDTASNTLRKALELRLRGIRISFVATLTRQAIERGAQRFIESCLDSGLSRIYSRPLAEYGFAATTKSVLGFDTKNYLTFFIDLLDEQIIRFNTAHEFVDESTVLWIAKIFQPHLVRHVDAMSPAGYALSACLINYDGNVFGSDEARMLYESTKNSHLPIGKLTKDGFARSSTKFHLEVISNSFLEVKPHCDVCAYQPFCGLDPVGTIREQDDLRGNVPSLSQCQLTLGICDAIFERIHNKSLTTEMVYKWLSAY